MSKTKSIVRVLKVTSDGEKKHFREISLPIGPLSAWKSVAYGVISTKGIDILKLRAQRKRKGGK